MITSYLRRILPVSRRLFSFREELPSVKLANTGHVNGNLFTNKTNTSWLFSVASRSMSSKTIDITYQDLLELKDKKDILIIDVRNPDEVQEGSIPGSVNIPLSELEAALQLDDGNFKKIYELDKPSKHVQMVFSCRSGNRSRRALELAQRLGFDNSAHYIGGWLDWVEQTK